MPAADCVEGLREGELCRWPRRETSEGGVPSSAEGSWRPRGEAVRVGVPELRIREGSEGAGIGIGAEELTALIKGEA